MATSSVDRPCQAESSLSHLKSVRRKLIFDQDVKKPRDTKVDRKQSGKRESSAARRRLNFGETDSSILLNVPDLLTDLASERDPSFRVKRTCLTYQMKTAMEELFQRRKFPNKKEKVAMAIELGVSELHVQIWFRNRRRKLKEQHNGDQFEEFIAARPQIPLPQPFLELSSETADVDSIITELALRTQSSSHPVDPLPARPRINTNSGSEPIDLNSNLKGSQRADRITSKSKQVEILRQL